MKGVFIGVLLLFVAFAQAQDYVIVLHGGAGNGIKKENINTEEKEAYELKMSEALLAGAKVLDTGGAAHLAVVEVIKVLEDSPLFNAGKGAVFTYDERNEMDASIMDGNTLNAGAVAGIGTVKNPITAALAVMQNSPHVMLSGKGAEDFAKLQGCEIVSEDYFKTEKRLKSLERYKKAQGAISANWEDNKMGTVGCAVLDKNGNLAAGTSTGGMTGKRYGRIGDSPIIGAGTYADNNTCAVSCTGHGEYFIRYAVAHDVSSRMAYGNQSFQNAASAVIHKILKPAGGDGGLIGVDKDGNVVMVFNTSGMFRAYLKEGQEAVLEMF
ncbi:isoaspartyl peptidase/L-asparaginase family protein [Owenweeksia hongkongensis]|uniref:isoaspartyl peptidase/L-asparaginase family protein n=1 Tax=Owenweeksia hongkongensis TaxID=253245 RepID=UPI003A95AE84